MAYRKVFARRFRFLRVLQGSLAIGGLFNLALGAALGLSPETIAETLHLPRSEPEFYLQIVAVLAALLGCFYLLAASDVRRYSGIVALAIVGRLSVAVLLVLTAVGSPKLGGLNGLAAVESLFAAIHAASWWSIRS